MSIRWSEKEYQEYLDRAGPKKKKKQRKPKIKQVKPSTVEKITGGLKITIFRIHPSLNRWTNWHYTKKHQVKKDWEDEICLLLIKYKKLQLEKAKVRIIYYTPNYQSDRDNYTPKFIMDGLVKSGLLADDNRNIVKPTWDFGFATTENQRTEITITWEVSENGIE